jgi:uncharacterized protein (TIGR00369 family)
MRDVEEVHAEWKDDGWFIWEGYDAYEIHNGPMFIKKIGDDWISRLYLEDKHMNGQGNLHGGMMATFADYALFAIVRDKMMESGAVTITLNTEMMSTAQQGATLEAKGEIIHETGRMLFLRGLIYCGEQTLMSFSGVLRKVQRKIQ